MIYYTSVGPNSRVVDMFAAERGIVLQSESVDIPNGENRKQPFTDINPYGQTPALVLDNGDTVSEVTAICEYLDETQPGDSLIGSNAEQRAQTRRWLRWADINICEPIGNSFRYNQALSMYESRIRCLPDAADGLNAVAHDNIAFIDGQLAGRQYLAGDTFTFADILLFVFLDFVRNRNNPLDEANTHVTRWMDLIAARASASV